MIDDGLASLAWAGSNVVKKKSDNIASHSFAAANFASILPDFRNKEQDIVRNAFSGGNYQSLRDMPDKFDTQTVSAAMNIKAARNLKTTAAAKKLSFKNMYFEYEHMADRFSLVDELNSKERIGNQTKRLNLHGAEFVLTRKARVPKHQDPFVTAEPSSFRTAMMSRLKYLSDPIEAFQDKMRAERKEHASKNISKDPFMPSGPGAAGYSLSADRAPVTALKEIVKAVGAEVQRDWSEYRPDVAVHDGKIAVQFGIEVDDEDLLGIFAYMKTLCRRNAVALRYRLRADTKQWGKRVADRLLFVLIPPWLHY